jgi:hypothetical protein
VIGRAIRETLLAVVPELASALRAELDRPRMLPIRQAPVAYRAILAAERAGELTVYRVGHASLVDEQELFAWIRRNGSPPAPPGTATADEIGELIAIGDRRRATRRTVR